MLKSKITDNYSLAKAIIIIQIFNHPAKASIIDSGGQRAYTTHNFYFIGF